MSKMMNKNSYTDKIDKFNIDFDIKEKDKKYIIFLGMENIPISEYAIVFVKDDKKYVSSIFKVENEYPIKKNIEIQKTKIDDYEKIKIIDIYTCDVVFEHIKEEEIEIPYLEDIKDDLCDLEKEHLKDEAEKKDELANKSENEGKKDERKDDKAFEETSCKEQISFNDGLDNLSDFLDILLEEKSDEKEKCLFEKENEHYTRDYELNIEGILEKFPLYNFYDLGNNYEIYIIDEDIEGINDINILYNGFVMPIIYPFMGYKNAKLQNAILPDWIFAKVYEEDKLKYYMYGVLADGSEETKPFKGSTGFIYYKKSIYDGFGYFVMYLSVKTGKICLI